MATRFLDTNFYKSPFVKSLPGELKSLYSFIICDCTASGIWFLDFAAAKLYTDFDISFETFEERFIRTGKAIKISEGKYFFPDFIEHQYPGGLSDSNKAHKNILIELRKYKLLQDNNWPKKEAPLEAPLKEPLEAPLKDAFKGIPSQGLGLGLGLGLGKEENEKIEIEKKLIEKIEIEKILIPEMLAVYKKSNSSYAADISRDYKPLLSISTFIHSQGKLNGNHIENKGIIIKKWEQLCSTIAEDGFYRMKTLSVISNQIQEIFQLNKNGKPKKGGRSTVAETQQSGLDILLRQGKEIYDTSRGKDSGT